MQATSSLLRQVHPNHWNGTHVASIAFLPNEHDEGLLSVYDGEQISAEASHRHYTEVLQKQSTGVWAVTVAEADEEGLASRVDGIPYPEHTVIDFTPYPQKERKIKAKLLAAKAEGHGCLYQPPAPTTPV